MKKIGMNRYYDSAGAGVSHSITGSTQTPEQDFRSQKPQKKQTQTDGINALWYFNVCLSDVIQA